MAETKTLSIKDAISKLHDGYTRYTKDEKEPGRSLQTTYGLSGEQCKEFFNHPKLKNLKTREKVTLMIIDDTDEENNTDEAVLNIGPDRPIIAGAAEIGSSQTVSLGSLGTNTSTMSEAVDLSQDTEHTPAIVDPLFS